ncbi:MAG: GTPase HflX, partial [Symbiobacteriaceae bacterium]|nr:GTPase HflX [Symbiobacteriaceae bacterium]
YREKAVLVTVTAKSSNNTADLDELASLAETAGAEVVGRVVQHLPRPDRGTYVGSGKAQELVSLVDELAADLLIISESLSPTQLNNLTKILPCRVLDRTQLILDIFAQRAFSREGRLQVELAQLTYLLPRLAGSTRQLSRLGGGIGTRGPGETKLETDRRILRRRIAGLHEEIDELRKQRKVQRQGRKRDALPQAALIGYTNAGKSTLMNRLTGSDLPAEDKLFATLDTTTRRLELPDGRYALLADTVGFIRNLPTHLVAAFRATLEELQEADLLLHVVDISHEEYTQQMAAVQTVLTDLNNDRPLLMVFNKRDLPHAVSIDSLLNEYQGSVAISSIEGQGIDILLSRMQELLYPEQRRFTVFIPFSESAVLQPIYAGARILKRVDGETGAILELETDLRLAGMLQRFLYEDEEK